MAPQNIRHSYLLSDRLLDGNKKTPSQVFSIVSNVMGMTTGLLLFGQAFLLISGFGLGISTNLVIFTVGIPILQIGVCIILGVLLIAKGSNIFSSTFKEKQVMSLCVSMAYSILDKKDKTPMFSKFKENGSNILKTELDNLSDNETVNDRQSSENTLFSNQFSSPLINQTPN